MKRTPIVLTATIVGLAGVLAFHTSPSGLGISTLPGAATGPQSNGSAGSQQAKKTTGTGSRSGSKTSGRSGGKRTVDGPSVNYSFGVLSVAVTVSGHKITKIGLASLNDYGNFRSESIDQQSVPILEQQALRAQSANIQGVSGASYTSAGFRQSLQSALQSLGM